jgi:DnaJ-domain-containing protein 1
MCCDQYKRVWENIYALAKGIEALRGLDRWGVSDFINRVFTGFVAIPERIETPWHEVLNVFPGASEKEIRDAYWNLAKLHHPDNGGDREVFERINQAYKTALSE